jgi:hypothetical protein
LFLSNCEKGLDEETEGKKETGRRNESINEWKKRKARLIAAA